MTGGYPAVFAAGLVSFASPCVLPVVPAYLSVLTGLDASELAQAGHRRLVARETTLFIAGFSAVFIALGLTATSLGSLLSRHHSALTRLSGLLVLAMGLFLAGSQLLRAPVVYQERRFRPRVERLGWLAAPVAGAAFGFGWTPCIGPVLASVLTLAALQGQAVHGAVLLAVYSMGLGLPFLAVGLGFSRAAGALQWVRRRLRVLVFASALVMSGFGVLLALDRLTWVTSQLQTALAAVGLGHLGVL